MRAWLDGDSRRRLLILLDESDGFFEADSTQFPETNRLKDLGQMPGYEGRTKVVFAGLHSVQRFAKVSNNTFKHLAQRPTVIGPLRPQFAYNLIARPMEALGYRFADQDLVNRILGYCSYQPFLLQMFGHRLVEHMHAHRTRPPRAARGEPPFLVTAEDVMAVEADPELKADITSTFRDTLNLDARYNVIANVLAHHAHEHGMDHRLTEVELRNECLSYWPEGFAGLNIEGFRAYLHEMAGLGVLAPNIDQRGWHLRSPNVLRMIGSQLERGHRIDARGIRDSAKRVHRARHSQGDAGRQTRAPLTAAQINDLLGDHVNQVRLVLGSSATRIEQVGETLRAVCEDLAERLRHARPQAVRGCACRRPSRRAASRAVRPGCALHKGRRLQRFADSCAAAAAYNSGRCNPVGRARHRTGPAPILAGDVRGERTAGPGHGRVAAARPARDARMVARYETLHRAERQARLLEVTGGWPYLTEWAVALAAKHGSEDAALTELAQELDADDGAAEFVETVGLNQDGSLAAALDTIIAYTGSGASVSDLLDAIKLADHPDPESALACLEALDVFDVDADGVHSIEPLLMRSWPRRWPAAADDE